jgi:SAM-dependent methyltransferase
MLKRAYHPRHDQNRMRHEGNVSLAREQYLSGRVPENLRRLLAGRYQWMNDFIRPGDVGLEVGCGTGLSKQFIRAQEYYLSDLDEYEWLDFKNVDALATPFDDASFDFVVNSNMIHHVASPLRFFAEMHRILKPGGRLIIQEINASSLMRLLLRLMRHEGYSYDVNVFDPSAVCTDPADLWAANCVIPNLLFDDRQAFARHVAGFDFIHHRFRECLCLINSGGVIAKTVYVPLPGAALRCLEAVDSALTSWFPGLLALQRQVVLERRPVEAPLEKPPAHAAGKSAPRQPAARSALVVS